MIKYDRHFLTKKCLGKRENDCQVKMLDICERLGYDTSSKSALFEAAESRF